MAMQVAISQVNQLSQVNNQLIQYLDRELADLFGMLNLTDPEAVRDALLEISPQLAQVYAEQAAVGSAEWYELVRRSQVGGQYYAAPAAGPDPLAIERNVRWAAEDLFTDTPEMTLSKLTGAMRRQILGASRDTIMLNTGKDPQSVGWHRIARATGCDFCVMLSQRGAVYKRRSADFAAHDNCRCRIAPSWDPDAPEVDVKAYEASKTTSKMNAEQRERHNQMVRQWMESNQDGLDAFRQELAD
jgi:hypothetical protein